MVLCIRYTDSVCVSIKNFVVFFSLSSIRSFGSDSHPKGHLWYVRSSVTLLFKLVDFPLFFSVLSLVLMIWTVSTEIFYFYSNFFERFYLLSTPSSNGDVDEMFFFTIYLKKFNFIFLRVIVILLHFIF